MSVGCLVLVPLRSFAGPKTRLAEVLSDGERSDLATTLATGVLDALHGWPVAVVTDDPAVVAWTAGRDVTIVRPGRPGLNPAVAAGADDAARQGASQVAVVHADLAFPHELDRVLRAASTPDRRGGVTAVPDRHGDGTNVLVVPTGTHFDFAYGPGSFARHRAEAGRLGLPFVADPVESLGWDVDTPDDLERYRTDGG